MTDQPTKDEPPSPPPPPPPPQPPAPPPDKETWIRIQEGDDSHYTDKNLPEIINE